MTSSFDPKLGHDTRTYVSSSCVMAEFRVDTSRHLNKNIYKRVGCVCEYSQILCMRSLYAMHFLLSITHNNLEYTCRNERKGTRCTVFVALTN